MKRLYGRLRFKDRVRIGVYWEEGWSVSEIGRRLGRAKSTISRELERCRDYDPDRANDKAEVRARFRRKWKTKLSRNPVLEGEVLNRLRKGWSPEQISRSLKLMFPSDDQMRISHETIYTYLYVLPRGELRAELLSYLRQKKKARSRRGRREKGGLRPGKIPEMISIEERPKEVERRSIAGHWEGDIVMGKRHKTALGTLVERKTRAVILVPLTKKTAPEVRRAFERAVKNLPRQMARTLTYDQGHKMSEHRLFTRNTKIKVYFCHPASPWERGTCENTNGLIRDFFPKGTDFSKIPRPEFKRVQNLLNERPRKTLGFLTPKEVFAKEVLQTFR